MIEVDSKLSITRQCELLGLPKSTYYYEGVKKEEQASLLDIVAAVNLKYPFYGYRRLNLEIRMLAAMKIPITLQIRTPINSFREVSS
ncbi:MAG TPA: hypothetical protein DD381_09980 [Lentisphaeria bacterium]|nr:MAG: hypothetical protein A2X47_13965 [Lentisphaerae bacterium GWF2_38_69]HBM16652.1 hypothetical protein [Lentisphaeria bacterium]